MIDRILSYCSLVSIFFLLLNVENKTQTISSTVTGGLWNNSSTWVGGVVPGINNDVVINGTVEVSNNLSVNSIAISGSGILQNQYDTGPTLTSNVSISNSGKILVNPGYYSGFALSTAGNIFNNGIWWPGWTTFTGSNTKEISAASGKRFQGNFQSLDSLCTIKATSDILFTQSFDLKKGILNMQSFALTLAASGNVTNGKVINTNDLILIEGAGITNITYVGTPNLRGLVQANGYDVKMEGTVTVVDTLQNVYNSYPTIAIKGSLTNNGVIRVNPGYYSGLGFTVTNNIINNGVWSPNWTTFTESNIKEITLAGGKRFQGNFQNLDSLSVIKAKSNILFTGPFDLKKGTLDMQNYTLTLAGVGNVTMGKVINTKDLYLIEGAAISNIYYVGNPNLLGLVQINGDEVTLEGNVTVTDTLQNVYNAHPTLLIKGPLTNNGVILVNPGYYSGFAISTYDNISNNGMWAPGWTYFTGPSTKEITLLDGKKFQCNFQNNDSLSIIRAKSNLVFTLPFDLKKSTMDMMSYMLTLSATANVYNGKLINVKDLFLKDGASISSVTYAGAPNLLGLVQIFGDDVIFEGNVTVTDTLQNIYNDHPTLTIKGSLTIIGIIKLNPGYYSGFSILVSEYLAHSGDISSSPITLNGTNNQWVMLINNKTINNRVIFDSKLGGTNYIWYKNGISIDGATSSTLNFDSLKTTNYGTYQCSSSLGDSRYFYVQLGVLSVKEDLSSGYFEGPSEFELSQNYPNPFNPETKIEYRLKDSRFTVIKVYGIAGNEIKTLVSELKPAGKHSVMFDGSSLPSGVYFYKIITGDFVKTNKMLLLK
jgi:Secretion system C-terminal sorting domain